MSGTSGGKAKKYVVGAIAGAAILAGGAVLLKPGAGAGSVLNAILPSTFVRQGPVCVKVNAGRLNGPRTLFDVPPADLDASFIADLRQLKPDWKIFHEREAAPCEPWVVLHLAAKSFALDQFTYGAATTAGVAGGIAIYAPRYDESSGIAIATSSTFGGLSGNMATAASQGIANFIDDARYTPQPAPPEDGKICITLFADDEAMAENVIGNFAYVNRDWTVYKHNDLNRKSACKPDLHMSVTRVPLANDTGRVGSGYLLSLRKTGETKSNLLISVGKDDNHELISVINDTTPKIRSAMSGSR